MNIFVSPIFALTFATVFIILGGYCLKCILFYHENKDRLNDVIMDNIQLKVKDVINTHEKKNNQKMSYREFEIHQYFNSPMMRKVNEMSRIDQEERQKEYEDYLKEGV